MTEATTIDRAAQAAPDQGDEPSRRVLLICPPFQHPRLSSMSVSHLATYLRERGVPCEEAYLHFELMRIVGIETYMAAIDRRRGFVAELLFAEALHGSLDPEWEVRIEKRFGDRGERRDAVSRFEERCVRRIESCAPDLVGITTSYNQLLPALWIAKVIKERSLGAKVVLGGTACSNPSGRRILEGYPQVDYAVSGYGELPLLALARGETPEDNPIASHVPLDIDSLPLPDYRPFVREAEEFGPPSDLRLQYQSSRGCWWGERKHCSFCGLNGIQMSYSARSPQKVIDDVRTLWERHGCNLNATDCILSRDHMREVLPRLAMFAERPWLFYELKANMTEEQVKTLARARVVGQVGIETLSTALLRLLNKGGTGIAILAVLKWCAESGARIVWNMLHSIPGEKAEHHEEQIEVMGKIPHFQPPRALNPIRIDRYSPYFDRYEEFGWTSIEPAPEYSQAHPHLDDAALADVAYHFRGEGGVSPEGYIDRLSVAFDEWNERHAAGEGLFLDPIHGLIRAREGARRRIPVGETGARILGATHRVTPIERVIADSGCGRGDLERLVDEDILHIEGSKVLNLAVRKLLPGRI